MKHLNEQNHHRNNGRLKNLPEVKDFMYSDFEEIAAKTDLLQREWAAVLHISERTLQRYAKDNRAFNFSTTDRILQIDKVLERGKEVFGSYDKFLNWLRNEPSSLEGELSLESLAGFEGIQMVLAQIGRIEHGVLS